MNFFNTLFFTFTFLSIVHCDYVEGDRHSTIKTNNSALNTTTNLDFKTIKDKILKPYCIDCHTQRHSSYENISVVRLEANQILERINSENPLKRMPKGEASLPDNLKKDLEEWIFAGAPEFNNVENTTLENENIKFSFADIKENVLKPNNCLECHTQYSTYSTVFFEIGSIMSSVENNRMPYPKSRREVTEPMSTEDKNILMTWIEQGAPEFVGSKVLPEKIDLAPNWKSLKTNVFGAKCILCHNSFGKRAPASMATYKEIIAWSAKSPSLFNTENPIESHFIGSILGRIDDDEFFFDSMPFNSPIDDVKDISAVTDEELEVIKTWIGLGLPEN